MYDVIKDILSKRRVVYYKSMKDFINRYHSDKNGFIQVLGDVFPTSDAYIEWYDEVYKFGSKSDLKKAEDNQGYQSCKLVIPEVIWINILHDYGDDGMILESDKCPIFMSNLFLGVINQWSFGYNDTECFLVCNTHDSIGVISLRTEGFSQKIDGLRVKRPYNSQMYVQVNNEKFDYYNNLKLIVKISNEKNTKFEFDLGVTYDDLINPNRLGNAIWLDKQIKNLDEEDKPEDVDRNLGYISLPSLLMNGFTYIHESQGEDEYWKYLIAENSNGIKLLLKLGDEYSIIYEVEVINPKEDFYPDMSNGWNRKEMKNKISTVKDLKRVIKIGPK